LVSVVVVLGVEVDLVGAAVVDVDDCACKSYVEDNFLERISSSSAVILPVTKKISYNLIKYSG
jgi:hypothetical protein